MRRVVHIFLLLMVVGQAVGLEALAGEDACAGECEDDAQGKRCPPFCPTCTCAVRAAPTIAPPVAQLLLLDPPTRTSGIAHADTPPATPEPREILRVPITRLA